MRENKEEVEILVRKAKKRVEGRTSEGRKWLEASPENSYDSEDYKVKVFVLEGSPPKGYVLADYCYGIVKAFGIRMQPLHTYRVGGRSCF